METSEKDVEQETIEHVKSETPLPTISSPAEKRLLRKLDIHVVPILMILFLLAFLDRINIGNARLQGLEKDLNMAGHDYNIALLIFFIPYVLLEVPSNLILKKFAPSWWISGIMFGWGLFLLSSRTDCADHTELGIITICQGLTASFGGLVACRFLLGVFEAGFMPGAYMSMCLVSLLTPTGCIYLIAMYYKRYELQWRLNVFFSASIMAGAVSGVLYISSTKKGKN